MGIPDNPPDRQIISSPISSGARITRTTTLPLIIVLIVLAGGGTIYYLIHQLLSDGRRMFAGAEAASEILHERIVEGDFDAIYRDSSPALRKAATVDQIRTIVGKFYGEPAICVHEKMIPLSAMKQSPASQVAVRFTQRCNAGSVIETLTWEVNGNQYALLRFNVSPLKT